MEGIGARGGVVIPKENVHFLVGRASWIGLLQELLDAQEELLESDGRLPIVGQQGETDVSRGKDVGMREGRGELAWRTQ